MRVSIVRVQRAIACRFPFQDGGGALNCLRFHGRTHMISAGDDGEICIWRTSDWECLLRLKGHKGPVLDLAIHPSGRIALSVGNDKKLMLWNLTTGAIGPILPHLGSSQLIMAHLGYSRHRLLDLL
eukprot:6197845-Pleurochrysis_carterae.AAC.4